MRTEQLTKCFEPLQKLTAIVAPLNRFMSLQLYHFTDHFKAVLLTWFSVLLVSTSVSVLFSPSMCLEDVQLCFGS